MAIVNIKGVKHLITCSCATAEYLTCVFGETETIHNLLLRIRDLEDQLFLNGENPYGTEDDGTDCDWQWDEDGRGCADYPVELREELNESL